MTAILESKAELQWAKRCTYSCQNRTLSGTLTVWSDDCYLMHFILNSKNMYQICLFFINFNFLGRWCIGPTSTWDRCVSFWMSISSLSSMLLDVVSFYYYFICNASQLRVFYESSFLWKGWRVFWKGAPSRMRRYPPQLFIVEVVSVRTV